ncbi:hypothetical protein AB8A20_04800 [Tardiphaga sp. 604_B6_N1_1]
MRLQLLHYIAKMFRIQFKVDGIPYGLSNHQPRSDLFSQSEQ